MQLDNTRIAVRERGMLDTFDMALRVIRQAFVPLILSFSAGAIPLFLLNYLLIGWMMSPAHRETLFYADDADLIARYIWDMGLLVAIETPLASIVMTAYLGQAMFVERPDWKRIFTDLAKMTPRVVWCLLLLRGILAAWLLLVALERYGDFDPSIEILGMGALACYALGIRFWRPYIAEIILLERNPVIRKQRNAMTVSRRSQQLHGPSSGDLFFRGLSALALAVFLTGSVYGSFLFCVGVLFNAWQPGPILLSLLLPIAMWIVAGFLSLVRFLSYLDLRIRHEGWEVELRMRAEGERLRRRIG